MPYRCTIGVWEPVNACVDEIVLSPGEFIDAWAAHEREAARLALAARRLEVCGG